MKNQIPKATDSPTGAGTAPKADICPDCETLPCACLIDPYISFRPSPSVIPNNPVARAAKIHAMDGDRCPECEAKYLLWEGTETENVLGPTIIFRDNEAERQAKDCGTCKGLGRINFRNPPGELGANTPEGARTLAENLLRTAIEIAEETNPAWYKDSDAKIAAIKNLKLQWDAIPPAPSPAQPRAYDGAVIDIPWVIRSLDTIAKPLRSDETAIVRLMALEDFLNGLRAALHNSQAPGRAGLIPKGEG